MANGGSLSGSAPDLVRSVLKEVFRSVRLRGTAYFSAEFRAPWGMEIQGTGVANFHLVVGGHCVVRDPGGAFVELARGDIAVFPHGDPHALASSRSSQAVPASDLLARPRHEAGTVVFGGDGEATTTIICGHFELDRSLQHPLFDALEDTIIVRAAQHDAGDAEWVRTATQLVLRESTRNGEMSAVIVDRIAEALLVQVLQTYMRQRRHDRGFLAALTDGGLARVLAGLHAQPADPWTVDDFARTAGMSRTSFLAAFKEKLGTSPMRYLTQVRMQLARELLTSSDDKIAQIAAQVGYDSEFAFARAYKRATGLSPGEARRRSH